MPRKILLLFAHPSYQRSRANRALVEAVHDLDGVSFRDLYELYPDLAIDTDVEQRLLTQHDALVVQHPFYWYACPALLKEWFDLVLSHGFAYGAGATALRGKPWLTAITAGGPPHAYSRDGLNRFTIDELLRPQQASAHLCNAVWQSPFTVLGGHQIDDRSLADAALAYRQRLIALRDGPLPTPAGDA